MLIKPDLKDQEIVKCLQNAYGLHVERITFLPLGADFNTAVYRVTTNNAADYFLKLRRGKFNEASVLVPKFLFDLGIKQVIPPLTNKSGELWTRLASFNVILYHYVDGNNGIDVNLSDQQWIEFGATMKKFHSATIPSTITKGIPQETFPTKWRQIVKAFRNRIEQEAFDEPIAAKMALFLKSKREDILELLRRTEHLACELQNQPLDYVLCHADIHGWNLLTSEEGALYIVDWDTLLFAPKERDLMFIGAGIGDTGRTPFEEQALFYQGYGPVVINQDAIAYYRFVRIIEDIGEYCEHIFLSDEDTEDRAQSFEYVQSIFLLNGAMERASQSYEIRKD
ncbi:TPA: aminoglycoside phosphotransferase family protein [Legionella pneumophila]|nr:aminoglycoside phosphotransferase family protein [Legionella pneumophila]HAU0223421.1 aminoglycoside phosphotransferase family protein [Legionella pneumophila]